MAEYASGGEKCGAPAPNGASVCALTKGHDGGHRNAWSTAEWPNDEHTPQPGGPGMQPCGNVGPFDGMTCIRPVGHSGYHEHPRAGIKSVWSDVTDEWVAKQLARLQRKVRAQANQINKLEELRQATATKQPEYVQLVNRLNEETHHLKAQASLTERENALRRQAETDRDSERERRAELIGNLILDIRRALALTVPDKVTSGSATWSALRRHVGLLCSALPKSDSAESAERTRRFAARFYRLASLLGVNTTGETWDTLLQRVADLKAELEVERVRANARKAELDKQGPSAVYRGNTPLAERVDELASRVAELVKDQDSTSRVMHVLNERLSKLETGAVLRCESRHSDRRCVMFVGHMGPHHAGPEAERWV